MFDLFYVGGPIGMSLITIELICLLLAAWKAPAWVKEIGLLALVTGLLWGLTGIFQALGIIQQLGGDISSALVAGAAQCTLIPIVYGLLVFALSLILRMVYKPRI